MSEIADHDAECARLSKRIEQLKSRLKDANYWRERHLADRDCHALRDERRFKYLKKLLGLGVISHEIWVTYTRIHGIPDTALRRQGGDQ